MNNIVIIGASSGIGLELALLYSTQKETQVFGTYLENEKESEGSLHYFRFDAMQEAISVEQLPEAIHGLVYCPGRIELKPFHRITEEEFLQDYRIQVIGGIKVVQSLLPKLKKAEKSSVVFFSTVAVQTGFPYHALVSASKGAIEGLVRALAAEYAPSIRFNAIAPSLTDTPLAEKILSSEEKKQANALRHPLKELGDPRKIAKLAAFLLSDDASFISGQVFKVDGGISTLRV